MNEDEVWCARQRSQVLDYLAQQGLAAANPGERPAWYVVHVLAVWALESLAHPGSVGWWVVSGDVPIDYVTCHEPRHPRQALRDIGRRWREAAALWTLGKRAETMQLADPGQEKQAAPLLAKRAQMLLDYAADDSRWGP